METLTNLWKSVTGTAQTQEQPVVENPSGMTDGVQGGRKKRRAKTRRGGKRKSRRSRK